MRNALYFIKGFSVSFLSFMFVFWTIDLSILSIGERGLMILISTLSGFAIVITNVKDKGGFA